MESDISLIEKVKNENDEQSLQILIERHSGLYLEMVNSVIPNNCNFIDKNDIIDDKNFSIYKAILNYDSSKNTKFSTYLGNETRWKCLNIFNRGSKYQHIDLEEVKEESEFTENSHEEKIISQELIDKIFSIADGHEDKRILTILTLRYKVGDGNKTMSWKNIASKINISIQGCINIHNRFIEEIKKEINNV
jgi:DNA-directed RNA polymerase specialized sigma subunit